MDRPERGPRPLDADAAEPDPVSADVLWEQLEQFGASAEGWLALQCRLLGGARAGLLLLGAPDRGPFSPAAVWPAGRPAPVALMNAAQTALSERRPVVVTPDSGSQSGPTSLAGCVAARPIEVAGRVHGALVVEVSLRSELELDALLEQMRWGFGWLQGLLGAPGGGDETALSRFETVLALVATALDHEHFFGAATAFATEFATQLQCDRVSVGFRSEGGSTVLRALSHSAEFAKKTNLVRAIEAAMDEALDQETTIVFPPPDAVRSSGVHAHAELSRQLGAGSICSLPIVHAGQTCGVITLERSEDRPFEPATIELCEAVAAIVGPALEVQRREDRSLAAKTVESLRQTFSKLVGPGHVALKLVAGVLVATLLFLVVAKGDYRITADTVVEPAVLRAVVAPFDGYIAEAPRRAGDRVAADERLGALEDKDLALEGLRWRSEREQLVKQHREAMAKREAPEAGVLSASIEEASAQLERIEGLLSRMVLRAPFDGMVVSGDLSQKLGTPVERGEVLFEVAPLDAYRLILQVEERDIDEVVVGQQGRLVLSSLPDEPVPFEVTEITPVSLAREGKNSFRVEALPTAERDFMRPGVEGIAKVTIDERRLIWIWSHDVIDWLRLTLWKWLP